MSDLDQLPVAVIGAGPVGLAAAAHLHERALPYTVLEAGDGAGALCGNGPTSASSRPGGTTSIRPPAACWTRPAG